MNTSTACCTGIRVALIGIALAVGSASAGQAVAMHYAHGAMPRAVPHDGTVGAQSGSGQPAKLGVAIGAIANDELDGLALEYGVRIQAVRAGSIAERAGIRPGDVVTDVAGRPAYSPRRMQHLVEAADGQVDIAVVRDGATLTLQADFAPAVQAETGRAYLGVRIQSMTEDLKEAFGAPDRLGVLVSQVLPASAAAQAGIRAGDVVVRIGEAEIGAVRDVHAALARHAAGQQLPVTILRDRATQTLDVTLGADPTTVAMAGPKAAPGWHGGHGPGHHHPHRHPHGRKYGSGCDTQPGLRRS